MLPNLAFPAEIRIAVASNFRTAMRALEQQYESTSQHELTLIFGSTGKHYAQIINGAPFDIFFAADAERPRRLERDGVGVAASRFTYAIGELVLWSPHLDYVDTQGQILNQGEFRHLAIANPSLAPYGRAALEVLQARGVWEHVKDRLVRGENIAQTFQFVHSGNAKLGFVAWSQVIDPAGPYTGSVWRIPHSLYQPIEQQAVLLTDHAASRDLIRFMQSPSALKIIQDHGYSVP